MRVLLDHLVRKEMVYSMVTNLTARAIGWRPADEHQRFPTIRLPRNVTVSPGFI
jgi:hypothetical protein